MHTRDVLDRSEPEKGKSMKSSKKKKKGPISTGDCGKKMKSIEEVTGIRPIHFSEVSEEESVDAKETHGSDTDGSKAMEAASKH